MKSVLRLLALTCTTSSLPRGRARRAAPACVPGPAPGRAGQHPVWPRRAPDTDASTLRYSPPNSSTMSPATRVRFGRSATGPDRTSRASVRAASLLTGAAPACGVARNPSTPSAMNHVRHRRTLSGATPKAHVTSPLVQPFPDNTMARVRSASSRRADRANASNFAASHAVTTTRGRPTMIRSTFSCTPAHPPNVAQSREACLALQLHSSFQMRALRDGLVRPAPE